MAAIDSALLSAVADRASGLMLNETAIEQLRRDWPGIRFTLCSEDDVPARVAPVLERPGFDLYLVNGSEHCLSLTNDPELAVGVVLAWKD